MHARWHIPALAWEAWHLSGEGEDLGAMVVWLSLSRRAKGCSVSSGAEGDEATGGLPAGVVSIHFAVGLGKEGGRERSHLDWKSQPLRD